MNKTGALHRSVPSVGRRNVPWRPQVGSRRSRLAAGFTLIELMVTIGIAALLMSLAAPSFRSMLVNNRMSAAANGLFNALNYARNTALSGNTTVVVCPVGAFNSSTCGASWASGWMVQNPGTSPATILQSWTLAANAPALTSPSGATSVSFNSRGITGTPAQFKLCDSRGANYARSVLLQATGLALAGQTGGLGLTNAAAVWGGSLTCP